MRKTANARFVKRPGIIIGMVALLLSFFVFWVLGIGSVDTDYGWHIAAGNFVLQYGDVPRQDTYSYTLPGHPWVDHSWLTDALFAIIHNAGGVGAVSSVTALAAAYAIFITVRNRAEKPILFLIILALAALIPFYGLKTQVISWVFFAVLFRVVLDEEMWQRYRLFSIFFFLLWANMHGSFLGGLIVFAVVIILRAIRFRSISWLDALVIAGCAAATLVNPYGISVWQEALSTAQSAQLHALIGEWTSLFTLQARNLAVWVFLGTSVVFTGLYWRIIRLEQLGLYIFFLMQALAHKRHFPVWVLVALPLVLQAVSALHTQSSKTHQGQRRFQQWNRWMLAVAIACICIQVFFAFNVMHFDDSLFAYPDAAVEYLRENPPEGNVFAPYAWGGYLIWQYPEKKVFIDGRMPVWDSVLQTYMDITAGIQAFDPIADKFSIDTVLWFPPVEPSRIDPIEHELRLLLGFPPVRHFDFLNSLEQRGWEYVYRDESAVVLQKNKGGAHILPSRQ